MVHPFNLVRKIQPTSIIYVIEMNNDTNEIEGIGVIKNKPNVKLEYTPMKIDTIIVSYT